MMFRQAIKISSSLSSSWIQKKQQQIIYQHIIRRAIPAGRLSSSSSSSSSWLSTSSQQQQLPRGGGGGGGLSPRLLVAAAVSRQQPTTTPAYYNRQQQQQVRSIFVQTADTPNPESLKFIPTGARVLPNNQQQQPEEGDNQDDEADTNSSSTNTNGFYVTKQDPIQELLRSPLAKKILDIQGIKSVYLGSDFITVTKYAEYKWKLLRPKIFEIIMTWAESGELALLDQPQISDTTILDEDDEIVAMIKELMEARIRPAVQEDGGDIRYVGFNPDTGIVTVKLAGSCVGCPSSSVTLKQGVENMLMHYIPEITGVHSLEEEKEEDEGGGTAPDGNEEISITTTTTSSQQKTYEQRLAAAGIPFSD